MHKDQPSSRMLTKEIMTINKGLYQEQEIMAYKIANLEELTLEDMKKKTEKNLNKLSPIFPTPETIYHKKYTFQSLTLCAKQQNKVVSQLPIQILPPPLTQPLSQPQIIIPFQHNKFKFIKLSENDQAPQINTLDLSFQAYLNELQKAEETSYLKEYGCIVDNLYNESTAQKQVSIQIHGTPLYNWGFQALKDWSILKYDCVQL
jgi:hypothetical protein